MAIEEVERYRRGDEAIAEYERLFEERYQVRPNLQPSDRTVLRDLVFSHGLPKVFDLLKTYIKMNGDNNWFMSRGHDLRTLKSSLNQVLIAMPKKGGEATAQGRGLQMQMTFHCDLCHAPFLLVCYGDELDRRQLCAKCKHV